MYGLVAKWHERSEVKHAKSLHRPLRILDLKLFGLVAKWHERSELIIDKSLRRLKI